MYTKGLTAGNGRDASQVLFYNIQSNEFEGAGLGVGYKQKTGDLKGYLFTKRRTRPEWEF
jgi:hypothetical protein